MHATTYIAVHLLPHAGKDGDQDVKSMLFYEDDWDPRMSNQCVLSTKKSCVLFHA